MDTTASKDWKEHITPDEAEVFEGFRRVMRGIQDTNSAQQGKGRGLHRKGILSLPAEFEVLDGLPAHARHGLFAKPERYESWLRFSGGAPAVQPDSVKDVRGFAIKVRGVNGEGALGNPTDCQDFLLIHLPAFAFPTPDIFIAVIQARIAGGLALPKLLLKEYGLLGMLAQLKRLAKVMSRPFTGFASTPFYSAAPFACGPYAVRMRLLPAVPGGTLSRPDDLAEDFIAHLKQPLRFDVQLQFFVNESQTPIEDASVDWPESVAPYVTVARLTVQPDAAKARHDTAFVDAVEADSFDPWKALAAHRPLGRVMRARKVIYFDSAQNRK